MTAHLLTRPPSHRELGPPRLTSLTIAGLAAAAGVVVWACGWRGVDMPAQQYNLHIFRAFGWSIWDIGWYGGHSVLTYSALFPVLARVLGMHTVAIASAAGAAWTFDQLVVERYGPAARAGSFVFAAGTVVPAIVGQLPFLLGEALGLAAILLVRRHRSVWAVVAGLAAALASPVAGVFLVLAAIALAVHSQEERVPALAVAGAAATPSIAVAIEFGTPGVFPLPWIQLTSIVAIAVAVIVLIPRQDRALRVGAVLYALAALAAFVVPNAMGGNVGRLVMSVGGALAVVAAVVGQRARRVLWALIAIPLICWQWAPLMSGVHRGTYAPATRAYYVPLIDRLGSRDLVGRLEIPLTRSHWEAAFVAPSVPLARGWERQQDMVVNPIFYQPTFSAAAYHRWLDESGVSWVALPDATLDASSVREAAVIRTHPRFLEPVWHDTHWQLYRVVGSPGLVSGPVRIVSVRPDHVELEASRPGTAILRLRFTSHWAVRSGSACRRESPDGWTQLDVSRPGPITLGVGLLRGDDGPGC